MKKYIGVLFISMMLFCTSCRLSSDNTSSAALSAPAVPYQEEKTPCQRKFPYADFSETYGTLLNYFTDAASGDAIFLYREEASLSHAPFGYEYHVVQYQKSTDAYEESALVFPENTLLLSVCLSPNGYLLLFISRKRFHNLPFLS